MTGPRMLTTYDELEALWVSAESRGTLPVVLHHAINPWILAGTEDGLRIAWPGTDHDHTPALRPQDQVRPSA
ncbi:hypothetical protein OG394_27410 [Kribbella sp. NBC_01245]|uniref:hypothetical protein n=1 Tax=Kribbella sp. NBC_01245 TaxID=2903578 RepID=UPI002E292E9E|nr:hypothetical protein [Kribbella sp. NBC_01245]